MAGARTSEACWKRGFIVLAAFTVLPITAIVLYVAYRFLPDRPVVYSDPIEHFKYGSTGGEREAGFPYWVWQVLPQVCSSHLPGRGYESLGMTLEVDAATGRHRDLPVGVSKRRHLGIDRVFLNCAACHASTVRRSAEAQSELHVGMPSHKLNLLAFQNFFFNCAADERFRGDFLIPAIEARTGGLSVIDKYLVYPVAIALMRERLLMLKSRFSFTARQTMWGPGRVDTFSAAKVLFNFPMQQLPAHELQGPADFPSVWLQAARKRRDDGQPMQLHWDGNNTTVEERNRNAAFGTGTTPPTLDMASIGRIEQYLLAASPPPYPYALDPVLAAAGKPVYAQYCASCHGASGRDFRGDKVGHVTPLAAIGTDRGRLDSFTYDLATNLATLYAGYSEASRKPRFVGFRKTFGYANLPLDGLWLRAPYLHNGSVPTLADLLTPADARPQTFYRGNDVYDAIRVGFVAHVPEANGQRFFTYDTARPGNGNGGHSGAAYGTTLAPRDKAALIEYLKTF